MREWYHTPYGGAFFDELPIGWQKAFGKELISDINDYYNSLPEDTKQDFYILDMKEKWGRLVISAIYEDDRFEEIVNKYEELSLKTCVNCGDVATHMTKGWIFPICDKCDKKE